MGSRSSGSRRRPVGPARHGFAGRDRGRGPSISAAAFATSGCRPRDEIIAATDGRRAPPRDAPHSAGCVDGGPAHHVVEKVPLEARVAVAREPRRVERLQRRAAQHVWKRVQRPLVPDILRRCGEALHRLLKGPQRQQPATDQQEHVVDRPLARAEVVLHVPSEGHGGRRQAAGPGRLTVEEQVGAANERVAIQQISCAHPSERAQPRLGLRARAERLDAEALHAALLEQE
eukprot:7134453-Prymnesium_polylepis.1